MTVIIGCNTFVSTHRTDRDRNGIGGILDLSNVNRAGVNVNIDGLSSASKRYGCNEDNNGIKVLTCDDCGWFQICEGGADEGLISTGGFIHVANHVIGGFEGTQIAAAAVGGWSGLVVVES
jgi:hypothetical protein